MTRVLDLAPESLGLWSADDQLVALPVSGQHPSQHFRILRPADLVVLDVLCFDMVAQVDSRGVALVAGNGARLEVRFTFQHALEAAEPEMTNPPPPAAIPIRVRAARGSRLVFGVPAGERIEYSTAGVLSALRRLPLMVAPLALPRVTRRRFTLAELGEMTTVSTLPGGVRLMRGADGLTLMPPLVTPSHQPTDSIAPSAGSLIASATALRSARAVLQGERAVNRSGLAILGGAFDLGGLMPIPPVVRPVRQRPRAPRRNETSIEAPFRLIISPSSMGGFAHADEPRRVAPDPTLLGDPERVELWHSRLGVRRVDEHGVVTVDETRDPQKIIRAIWTRDLDNPAPGVIPFLASLTGEEREVLVRQSSDPQLAVPAPVDAEKLYLTALGAWLELHGRWDPTPYAQLDQVPIEAWDHEATVGRDQYVRVAKPFYLFPFGHRCTLITITERKTKEAAGPQSRLYQRKFLAITEPVRTFDSFDMPFRQVQIRPLITPNLDFKLPLSEPPVIAGSVAPYGEKLFWPMVASAKFRFVLDCLDHDGRRTVVQAPLLAVAINMGSATERAAIVSTYENDPERPIAAAGQNIAMGQSTKPGDTAFETITLRFTGTPGPRGSQRSTPRLANSDVVVPAIRHLAGDANGVTVQYATTYLANGFTGQNASPQVMLELPTMRSISFGGGTDRSGGFIQPDLPVRGLSRAIGIVGDIGSVVSPPSPAQAFDPGKFLLGVAPKLFGLFELTDILALAGLDKAPKFITEQLDAIAALVADLEQLQGALERGIQRLADDAASAATTALRQQAQQAQDLLDDVVGDFTDEVTAFRTALDELTALDTPSDLPAVTAKVAGVLNALAGFVTQLRTTVDTAPLPPLVRAELQRLVNALAPVLDVAAIADTLAAIVDFVNGFDPANMSVKAKFEWRPTLTNFPDVAADDALFYVDPQGFVLSVEARASGSDGVGFDALAELSDFGLNLFPTAPLMKLSFDRLAFRASSGRKPEVDVVFNGIEFVGVLSFIETLKELIPFDGFSDPPYVDVSTEGVTAGFDLALPNVGVGVFSLENISLGADVRVPFLGEAVTVGFYFCTREKPFRLTVMCIGGGGFVGIRLSPQGLVLLEMSLEAAASLSIDLGVASGSVSIAVGVYLRLEGEEGSLTGYFRIRGEVDVLGLISASITLELSLTYEFATGKLVGRASISIEVEVFFFSFSVEVSCERRLAGSNGDPTFAEFLGLPADGVPITTVPVAWSDYCAAFAGV